MKRKPITLRSALRRGLVQAITCTALFAAPVVGASLMPMHMDVVAPEHGAASTVSRADRMVQHGQCWTGEAPAEMQGVIPGHVWADGQYRGSRTVGLALEQLFEGKDHGLHVQAFCK